MTISHFIKSNLKQPFLIFAILPLVILLLLAAYNRDQLGDVDDDGYINVVDVVLMIDIALTDGEGYTEYEIWASDVNADDETNIIDIVIIVEIILGNQEECPEGYAPCDSSLVECCLDTTSHNFTWETDLLSNSYGQIYDIAVINEDNIWAVGEISEVGPNGEWMPDNNAAHWNGEGWELLRITFPPWHLFAPRHSIFAINENDIWMGSSIPTHWDGEDWEYFYTIDGWISNFGSISGIWGTSYSDMYFIGSYGKISHFDGESFTLMAEYTDIHLNDIWGTASDNIWVAGEDGGHFNSIVLHYDGNEWEQYYWTEWHPGGYWTTETASNLQGNFRTVWCWEDWVYLAGSEGVWRKQGEGDIWQLSIDLNNPEGMWVNMMRGNNINDIMLVGNYFKRFHFNGMDWQDVSDTLDTGVLRCVSSVELFFTAGGDSPDGPSYQAIVTRGYRE